MQQPAAASFRSRVSRFRPVPAMTRLALFAAVLLATVATPSARAEEAEVEIPTITVTAPYRGIPTTIARAGSSVSVVTADEIRRTGARTLNDVLATVPGVALNSSGGEGAATSVYIRGANNGQSLVLVDGVRLGDPSATDGGFNFGAYPLDNVERIEVLRGPQSALYGSDALGGVINIVTKKPEGPLAVTATAEVGSYVTHRETLSVSGSKNGVSLLAGGAALRTSGFSSFARGSEKDATTRLNGYGKISWEIDEDLSLDLAIDGARTKGEYDGFGYDTPANRGTTDILNGRATLTRKAFDDRWISALTVFANSNKRVFDEDVSYATYDGLRAGLEYQGTARLGDWGTTVFGAGYEREAIDSLYDYDDGFFQSKTTVKDDLDHLWAFALYQYSPTERWHLSASARVDDYEQSGTFGTWRLTSAYEIFETETVLRASLGTGAKAPTPYQLFSQYRNPNGLDPETSIGGDVGIEQTLWDGRAKLSASLFYNRFEDLIGFEGNRYVNVKNAETAGLELSGSLAIVPNALNLTASYTYLDARDLDAGKALPRRPRNAGSIGLSYTGIDRLTLGAKVLLVGDRRDIDFNTFPASDVTLSGYARVDLDASYALNDNVELTGRIVNLFDTRYEEVLDYGTPGFSAYAGLKIKY